MITKFSHTTLFVNNQDKAFDFYINKLGFNVHTDAMMENGYRWLTITAPDTPEFEIILMPVLHESSLKSDTNKNGLDAETVNAFKVLLTKGVLGAGVMYTSNCRATYKELKEKGVNITEPKDQFYGTECVIKDDCGNWFSMTQPKEGF